MADSSDSDDDVPLGKLLKVSSPSKSTSKREAKEISKPVKKKAKVLEKSAVVKAKTSNSNGADEFYETVKGKLVQKVKHYCALDLSTNILHTHTSTYIYVLICNRLFADGGMRFSGRQVLI